MNLLRLSDLQAADVRAIWSFVPASEKQVKGTVAWSFEGNGIRTRTSFIQAFRELGLRYTELPNLLKTEERPQDLAGYLDPFYDLYVVRESNHARLTEFSAATRRPVINAMSGEAHPCEVLADAYFIDTQVLPLERARICLWGPPTNVLRSWHDLAAVLGFSVTHVCEKGLHEVRPNVQFQEVAPVAVDVLITDGWPGDMQAAAWSLTQEHMARMGDPKLLPTPPFSIGRELSFDPVAYSGFVGYAQKQFLLPVQKAIVRYAIGS